MKTYITQLTRSNKIIIDTPFILVIECNDEIRPFIKMSDGEYVEHNPFKNDLMGLSNALLLAADCCAGKFYLKTATAPIKQLTKL